MQWNRNGINALVNAGKTRGLTNNRLRIAQISAGVVRAERIYEICGGQSNGNATRVKLGTDRRLVRISKGFN